MADQAVKVRSVMPKRRSRTCACSDEDVRCQSALQGWEDAKGPCPPGAYSEDREQVKLPSRGDQGAMDRANLENSCGVTKKDFKGRCAEIEAVPGESLLRPDQFNFIAYPGCRALNARYRACGVNAYRTSKDRRGEGCIEEAQAICRGERAP